MIHVTGYQFTEQMHTGLYTSVYRGIRLLDGLDVVMKTRNAGNDSADIEEMLRHEHEMSELAGSSAVRRSVGLVQTSDGYALILSYIPGMSLQQMDKGQGMDLELFFPLSISMVEALVRIHKQQVLHGDLKPGHIIVDPHRGKAAIIDFSHAQTFAKVSLGGSKPDQWHASLAYMSPEQTGRINRGLDYRTDLYSLGVIWYEMLTGRLPFQAVDPIEWAHCHTARVAEEPRSLRASIPAMLSRLVMKLLNKSADERYRSAEGVQADMEAFYEEWKRTGDIPSSALDTSEQLELLPCSKKLYGREEELQQLADAYERAAAGQTALVSVSGRAGSGKSELVQAFGRTLLAKDRASFASGRFGSSLRLTPYGAVVEALRQRVRQILRGGIEESEHWAAVLRQAVQSNGQLMIDLIPELERLIGAQPQVEQVAYHEAENRFQHVFFSFIRALTQPERPLVLFLDDMQWADPATWSLLEKLLFRQDMSHILLIAAYREEQQEAARPVEPGLSAVCAAAQVARSIALQPLNEVALLDWIMDTLQGSEEECLKLTAFLVSQTQGNPYLVQQYLQAIQRETSLAQESAAGAERLGLEQVSLQSHSERAQDLLLHNFRRLSLQAQYMLQLAAAAAGPQIDISLLASMVKQDERQLLEWLQEGEREGIVARKRGAYRFQHHRYQEMVYRFMSRREAAEAHWLIGRSLIEGSDEDERKKRVFEIVNHVCSADNGFESAAAATQDEIIRLLCMAGRKAKESMAYESAAAYLSKAQACLGHDWQESREQKIVIYTELAICLYMQGSYHQAESLLDELLEQVGTALEKAQIYNHKVMIYTTMTRFDQAVEAARTALGLLDIELPTQCLPEEIGRELQRVFQSIGGRNILDLAAGPELRDPKQLMVMHIYSRLLTVLYFTNSEMYAYTALQMVHTSLQYGIDANSAVAFGTLGVIMTRLSNDYDTPYAFGQLALLIAEAHDKRRITSAVQFISGALLSHWKVHVSNCVELLKQAKQNALETGNFNFVTYSAVMQVSALYHGGSPLDEVYRIAENNIGFVRRTKDQLIHTFTLFMKFAECLKMNSADFAIAVLHDDRGVPFADRLLISTEKMSLLRCYGLQAFLFYAGGRYAEALEMSKAEEKLIDSGHGLGMWLTADHVFIQALILAALLSSPPEAVSADSADSVDRAVRMEKLLALADKLSAWAASGPDNFLHQSKLLEVEICSLQGKQGEAIRAYHQSIELARRSRNYRDEAMACELAAACYERMGIDTVAKAYIQEAWAAYINWGAIAKARWLERKYGDWLAGSKRTANASSPEQYAEALKSGQHSSLALSPTIFDWTTVVKASQMISEEVQLEKLLEKLLTFVLENAAATGGFLAIRQGDEWIVAAEGNATSAAIAIKYPMTPMNQPNRPVSLLSYVSRTEQSVVLNDACAEGLFVADAYFAEAQSKSVLCLPVMKQGHMVSLLYLENNLITHAFTTDRLEMLGMLASQLAISIDNASLYKSLEQKVKQRTEELELLNEQYRVSENTYRTIFENTGTAMVILSKDGVVTLANTESERLFSTSVVGRPWTDFIFVEDLKRIAQYRAKRLRNPSSAPSSYEARGIGGQGRIIDLLLTVSSIADTAQVVVSIVEITERKKTEEMIRNMAYFDTLTGLPNRKHFEEKLTLEIGRAHKEEAQLAVLFLDLDGFKQVNDTYGHRAGDSLLVEVARRIQSVLGEQDMVSRLGGDEFTLLLARVDGPQEALLVTERIFAAFQPPADVEGIQVEIRSSIGISLYPRDGRDPEALVKAADDAMYQAKKKGKNQYCLYG